MQITPNSCHRYTARVDPKPGELWGERAGGAEGKGSLRRYAIGSDKRIEKAVISYQLRPESRVEFRAGDSLPLGR
ncbi:hypothetical protein GRJ2_001312900 [Grus japonensis]|uniref:Uncharacterized protein n=1 Tax=Grus japonensis TaxID=30415 RepID=A0ABC9WT65_GRUJA